MTKPAARALTPGAQAPGAQAPGAQAKDHSSTRGGEPLHETVAVQLSLTIVGKSYPVAGSNVTLVELKLTRYGLRGRLAFWMVNNLDYGGTTEDKLFAAFTKTDPIAVALSLATIREDDEAQLDEPVPWKVQGLVDERTVAEQPYEGTDEPAVLARYYEITFCDPAALLWTQHDPCELYTDKSVQEVIDLHKGEDITIAYQGEFLSKKRPLLFLGPDADGRGKDTFYDLVMWFCDHSDLLFTYNYKDQSYRIAEELEELPTATLLSRLDVLRLTVRYPPVPRYQARVQNAYTEDARRQATTTTTALRPMVRDHLVRTRLGTEFDDRAALETKRLRVRGPVLRMDFRGLPMRMFGPGDCADLTNQAAWQAAGQALPAMATADKLRVVELSVRLQSTDGELRERELGDNAHFTGHCTALLEPAAERAPRLPDYIPPHYPHLVEGKVVSEQGEDDEETYDIETDSKTSLRSYKVKLPLFADQIVRTPFLATPQTGHFYFPIYKNARVLCALDFLAATLVECLDWRVGDELPLESQGNQLLMGKKLKSCVAMTTVYESGMPVFTLRRNQEGDVKDFQSVQIKQGQIAIVVSEMQGDAKSQGVRTINVTMDKVTGTTITVEYPEKKTTQTILMDGTQLQLKVQGEKDTSTYTQVADTVTIVAKNINLQAETFKVTSSKTSSWQADDTLTMGSKKDMSISTDENLQVKAAKDGKLDAKDVTITAQSGAEFKGTDTKVSATSSLTATATTMSLEGKTSGTMKGATLEISASASLTCKSSAIATFKGQMTNIEGSLIKLG